MSDCLGLPPSEAIGNQSTPSIREIAERLAEGAFTGWTSDYTADQIEKALTAVADECAEAVHRAGVWPNK
jgi:hypothetical protein